MSNKIQDLEQEVLMCWQVTDDLSLLANETEDQVASFTDELERLTPTAQEILIERALEDD
jgi:hypothetical protein